MQVLPDWSRLLTSMMDELRRGRHSVHVAATGSLALSLGRGSRETMAGRFEKLRLLHRHAAEIARRLGRESRAAALDVVRFGGDPGATALQSHPARWRAYIRDSIVEPAIGRDLPAIEQAQAGAVARGLRDRCRPSCTDPLAGEDPLAVAGSGSASAIAHDLQLLEDAVLVAAVQKYSAHVVRRRAATPKLVVLNNALLSAAIDEASPTPKEQPERWGRCLGNACIAAAWNAGRMVHYWREGPLEVDLITFGSWGKWAAAIKTGRLHLRGL